MGVPALFKLVNKGVAKRSPSRISVDFVRKWMGLQYSTSHTGQGRRHPPAISGAHYNISQKNHLHIADLIQMVVTKSRERKAQYILLLIDVATRYKAARVLYGGKSSDSASAIADIYEHDRYLTWPKIMQTDAGVEFKGDFSRLCHEHGTRTVLGIRHYHTYTSIVDAYGKQFRIRLGRALYGDAFHDFDSGDSNAFDSAIHLNLDRNPLSIDWVKNSGSISP